MFDIKIDQAQQLVEVRLDGLMGVDEVTEYINELRRQFIANRLRSYVMVIDVSAMPIQTQDMIRTMGEHMAGMPKARAIAVATGSSLARMQIRRLFTQSYARITSTVEQGRAWVMDGVEPPVI